jgi:Zn-dependent peptidase ImmA (M78 family)/lambda repressor-like predicted transcriptional regulator
MSSVHSLQSVLDSRQMSLNSLSERSGLSKSEISAILNHDRAPDNDELLALAETLHVPPHALFAEIAPQLSLVPDFRRANPTPSLMPDGVIAAISYVERLSQSLVALDVDLSTDQRLTKYTGDLTKKNAAKLAKEWRSEWGLAFSDQLEMRSAHKVYAHLRDFIEGLGVFVIHRRFDTDRYSGAYLQVGDGPHTIMINTGGSSKARKLFTLAHEFCHVLLGKTGVSNASVCKNKIETFCNQFAAYFLVPTLGLKQAINRFQYTPKSNWNHIRLQCIALRLVDIGVWSGSDYGAWMGQYTGVTPKEDTEDPPGGSGGQDNSIQTKRTQYGSSLIRAVAAAKRDGLLDKFDVYRLIGLKPKYQAAVLGE